MRPVLWADHGSVEVDELHRVFDAWQAKRPGSGILALASPHEPDDVTVLQEAAATAGVALVGAIGPGLADNAAEHFARFPLALHLAEGEPLVRFPRAIDTDDSLTCVGEVPDAALLSIVEAPQPASLGTADAVATGACEHAPAAALMFACAGRLMHGGAAANLEFAALRGASAPVPGLGALSLGEIANHQSHGYPRFHAATLCAMPWS